MSKGFVTAGRITLLPSSDLTLDLIGNGNRERFLLDLWRGTFKLSKIKYQTRGRQIIVLARLDINGAPHTNPDGEKIVGTHLHIYKEGFDDKWAYPLDPEQFSNPADIGLTLENFCEFCNISGLPPYQIGLL